MGLGEMVTRNGVFQRLAPGTLERLNEKLAGRNIGRSRREQRDESQGHES
jgi:hypothetical protein